MLLGDRSDIRAVHSPTADSGAGPLPSLDVHFSTKIQSASHSVSVTSGAHSVQLTYGPVLSLLGDRVGTKNDTSFAFSSILTVEVEWKDELRSVNDLAQGQFAVHYETGLVVYNSASTTSLTATYKYRSPIVEILNTITVTGSITADTELPSAITLSDTAWANDSSLPALAAALLVNNGTKLIRVTGDVSNGLDVDVTRLPALVAGTALIGKVGIDQTTPGTTNVVAVIPGQNGVAGGTGVDGATVQRMTLATNVALPAGANAIGKLAANSGVIIGDVNVTTVPTDPFGANADAASATGSISAKLRFIAATGIPVTGLPNTTNAGATVKTSDYDSGAGTDTVTMFGLALPASGGAVQGGTSTNPIRIDPTNATTTSVQIQTHPALTGSAPTANTVGVASGSAVAANGSRKGLILTNTSNAWISLGVTANAAVLYSGITLSPNGGTYNMTKDDFTTGQIFAIASAASSNLAIQEFT